MPYSNVSDAPANIRKLNGKPLSLAQVNWIARVADGIPKDQVDSPWAVAISQFKRAHKVEGDKWVKKGSKEEKELTDKDKEIIARLGLSHYNDAVAFVQKNDKGTYTIETVSTAALKDREGETFTTTAMDYDIQEAERLKDYPEFRVFHSNSLGIGKVTEMRRIGIFAYEKGESYDDPFSMAVCEKMLINNDGRWRVSRGFRVYELDGSCPECSSSLSINTKHMVAGFRCPTCSSVHLRFKGVLGGIRFKKARTFDITVTDVPAVPYTGAYAWRTEDLGGSYMNKKELKQRLLDAEIPEDAIDSRLKELTDEQLKEFDNIPEATLLKEFGVAEDEEEKESDGDASDDTVVLEYDSFMTTVKEAVRTEVEAALEGFSVEVEGFDVEMKEVPGLADVSERLTAIEEKIDIISSADEDRLKEMLRETPRSSKVRIMKAKKKAPMMDEEEEEEEEGEVSEKTKSWIKSLQPDTSEKGTGIVDQSGKEYDSLASFVRE